MKTTTKRRLQGDSRQLRIGVLRVYSSKLHDSSTNQSINQSAASQAMCSVHEWSDDGSRGEWSLGCTTARRVQRS